jgi:biotin synthesis protein BioG
MKQMWLTQGKNENLLIFCNGWGMDQKPFSHLKSLEYDVLTLFDYRNLSLPLSITEFQKRYNTLTLVSWSMGVWVGQTLFQESAGLFKRKVAINGTLCPIDDIYGIPVDNYEAVSQGFDLSSQTQFYKRMCRDKSTCVHFLQHQPDRSTVSQAEELVALQQSCYNIPAKESIYDDIIVARSDYIMPTKNQLRFWGTGAVRIVDGYHYVFTRFSTWDEIVAENNP